MARFPLQNAPLVERRLEGLFAREAATALVGSAACGADLVAMTVAARRGMRRCVVLPFGRDRFRETSVTDRPGEWGQVYDRLLDELERTGDVVVLDAYGEGDAYAAANAAIMDRAAALAQQSHTDVLAVLVWEGKSRLGADMTAAFGAQARNRGWRVEHVITL